MQTSRPKGCSDRGIKPSFCKKHRSGDSSYSSMSCLLQYKEVKHSKVRNEHGTWHPQYETLLKHISNTPWGIKADNFSVAVVDAQAADDLYLPLAGEKMCLLCKCKKLSKGSLSLFAKLVQPLPKATLCLMSTSAWNFATCLIYSLLVRTSLHCNMLTASCD